MKKQTKIVCSALVAALAVGSATALAACNNDPLTDEPLTGVTVADFTQGKADTFFASDGWCNGDVFNVTWTADNVDYKDGEAHLGITDAPETAEVPYLGGELRSYQNFGYGDYSVRMKPAKVAGTASTFFTYTGPSELDEDGNPNPHDEIDIEFLGKDTTKVQFNYFVDGKGGHEHMYDLGFDASLEYHDYGFRWTEDYITWFVDGKPVYRVNASAKNPLPSTPGRILMNHWSGTQKAEGWMGKYTGSDDKVASYKTVKTSALPIGELPAPEEGIDETNIPQTGWVEIDDSGFDGWGMYDVDKTDGITISHDEKKDDYKCCGMSLAESYSWVKFSLKNNSDIAADLRVDITKQGAAAASIAAVFSKTGTITLDAASSAAIISLDAEQTIDVVLKIKDTYVDQMTVFLNSTKAVRPESGSVTITDIMGIVNEDVEKPTKPVEPEKPVVKPDLTGLPTEGWTNIEYAGFDGWGAYDVDKTDGITISHDEAKSGYKCCGMDLSESYDYVAFDLTNNTELPVEIRIDIKNKDLGGGVEAVYSDGADFAVIESEGCVIIQLAANETHKIGIKVKDMVVNQMVVFLNSMNEGSSETGSVTISNLVGIVEGTSVDPEKPGGDKDPENPGGDKDPENPGGDTGTTPITVPNDGWESVADGFDGWEMYTLERFTYENFNAVRILNKGAAIGSGNCFGMDLQKNYRYLMFTLVNEFGDPIEIRFEVKQKNTDEQTYKSAITGVAPAGVQLINDEYNAAVVNLAGHQRIDVVLQIDENTDTNQIVVFAGSMSETPSNQCRVIMSDVKGIVKDSSTADTADAPSEGWTDISVDEFNGNEVYEVANTADGLTVSHADAVNSWSTAQMDLTANYSWMKFSVTNNGTETAKLRIDVKDKTNDKNPGTVQAAYPANYATVIKGINSLGLTIPAGETADVVINLESKYFDWLVVFFDSFDQNANAESGSITISNFQGIVDESIKHADPNAQDKKDLAFKASKNDAYNLDKSEQATDTLNVTYNNISYGSLYYISSEIESFAAGYNTFTFTIANKGNQEIQLRIGITSNDKYNNESLENINVCNKDTSVGSTTYQDNRGGTYTSVGAGQTQTITIKYDKNLNPKQLLIYIDSCKKDANEQRSGNVTISDFTFSNT